VKSNSTEFVPTVVDKRVYVEGVTKGSRAAGEEVKLVWVNGTNTSDLDTVKLTVYEVKGVMNVPGLSIYTYTADVPGGGVGSWVALDGALTTVPNQNTASILWDAGPIVGRAIFSPVPGLGFAGEWRVNVVQVQLDALGPTNKVTYPNQPAQNLYPAAGTKFRTQIMSSPAPNLAAMVATLRVSRIEGPTVDGQMRGVRFMEMGFIQNGQWTQAHADFNLVRPRKRIRFTFEGSDKFYVDKHKESTKPWQYSNRPDVSYFRASSDSALTNKDFTTNDRPAMQATDKMKVTINGVNDSPAVFALIDNFELSFAVATTEEPSNPAKTYTQRAVAEWHFDGSGTLTPVTPLGGGIWTRTPGARNDGASAFTEVTSGLRPRATTGDDMNWINDTKGFVMVNQ